MSNSKINKFKSGIKNNTQVTINLSSNVIGESNDETNFPYELFLTIAQVSEICKALANGSSGNIKFSKTQLSKMIQLVGFLGRLCGPLLKTGLSLIGNALKPLAKSVLVHSGLNAVASTTVSAIHKKILGLGKTTLIFSNEDLNDIM